MNAENVAMIWESISPYIDRAFAHDAAGDLVGTMIDQLDCSPSDIKAAFFDDRHVLEALTAHARGAVGHDDEIEFDDDEVIEFDMDYRYDPDSGEIQD